MKHHELKTDPEVFAAVDAGAKTHEIRFNDRGFAVGDVLLLRETKFTGYEMRAGKPLEYTGRITLRAVSHIQEGYGLAENWVILSFKQAAPIGYVEAGHIELLAHDKTVGKYVRLYAVPFGDHRPTVPVYGHAAASARCEECAGAGKIGPNENPTEMDCEVCNGTGREPTTASAIDPLDLGTPDALHPGYRKPAGASVTSQAGHAHTDACFTEGTQVCGVGPGAA